MFSKPRTIHTKPTARLSQRIAEEAQLLAEEKWIIEALKKIKAQRNGLQIERLHLESMRAKVLERINKDKTSENPPTSETAKPVDNLMAGVTDQVETRVLGSDPFEHINIETRDIDDDVCNTEELNLSVTNSVFNMDPYGTACDEEEDDEDMENCVLDIDLLMSGK